MDNHLLKNDDFIIINNGFCPCCDSEVIFSSKNSWLRDYYTCSKCGSIPRERALMYCIEKFYPNWRDLSIHESSPANRGASIKLKRECKHYLATHFFPDRPLGEEEKGYLNINLESQDFENEMFDLVITQDVMEHVFYPGKAFSEIARTLNTGGSYIFTVPLVNKNKPSEIWASINNDGTIEFLKEPEYHGNPIDANGCPVTMHWGYDICDFIFKHSGLYTSMIIIDNLDLGIRGEYIEVLISRKL